MKISYFLLLFITFLSCNNQLQKERLGGDDNVIKIEDTDSLFLSRITVTSLEKQNYFDTLEYIGLISAPPQSIHSVYSLIPGFVKELSVYQGSFVKKGDVICYLSHPDIMTIQQDFLRVYTQYQTDSLEYIRQLKLFNDSATSARTLEVAKSTFYSTRAQLKSIEKLLMDINLNPKNVKDGKTYSQVAIKSPVDGYIKSIFVNSGGLVQPNTLMFSILDIHHVHVELFVNLDISKKIDLNDTLIVKDAIGNLVTYAKVINISPFIDETSKLVHVHCHLTDTNYAFIVGQQVQVLMKGGFLKAFILPKETLIFIDNKNYIFIKKDDKTFVLKEINLIKRTSKDIIFNTIDDEQTINNAVVEGIEILRAKLLEES